MKKISLGLVMVLAFAMLLTGFNVAKAQTSTGADSVDVTGSTTVTSSGQVDSTGVSATGEVSTTSTVAIRPVSFFDKVGLFFTFNKENRVKKLQDFSERSFKLAEQKLEAGSTEEASVLFKESEEDIKKATDSTEKILDEAKQKEILSSIGITATNRTAVLTAVQAKVENPTAKAAIDIALERQASVRSDVDDKIGKLLEKISQLEAKIKELENRNSATGEKPEEEQESAGAASTSNIEGYNKETGQIENGRGNSGEKPEQEQESAGAASTSNIEGYSKETGVVACTPTIKIISPNGGQFYYPGESIMIKWKTACIPTSDNVYISLHATFGQYTNGATVAVLANSVPNTGSYTVTLPGSTLMYGGAPVSYGNVFKVYIQKAGNNPTYWDYSDNFFNILGMNDPGPSGFTN